MGSEMEEEVGGILIRFIYNRGSLAGKDPYLAAGSQLWIREVSDISNIGLPEYFAEELRRFWYSQSETLYLTGECDSKTGVAVKIVAERISGRRSLFVFGAGHVGRSVALMGIMIGLEVTLIDDRQEFLVKEGLLHSGIHLLSANFDHIQNCVVLNKRSVVVIVTRGHQFDEVILKQIANYEVGYVGMIGSKRRVAGVFRRLRQKGIDESFLDSVKAPIGLDIGARSPQEIAVAVHAEIIKHFSSADASAAL